MLFVRYYLGGLTLLIIPHFPPMSRDLVYVHADESCLGNQFRGRANPGGAAGLMEVWRGDSWQRRDFWVFEADTTNNRMALRSALEALRSLKRSCDVHFVSDSQYLVKGISEWLPGWKRRGWRRKGGAIENLELWKNLDAEMARHVLRARWVRGHAGHPRNEYANFLATTAAKEQMSSGGLVPSGFDAWLAKERERSRYLDFREDLPPA